MTLMGIRLTRRFNIKQQKLKLVYTSLVFFYSQEYTEKTEFGCGHSVTVE